MVPADGSRSGTGRSSSTVKVRQGPGRPTRDEGPAVTSDAIVDAAYRIARDEGLGAIQIRRIADQLGVWPRAVYHYVPSKGELLKLVADRALATRERASLPSSAPWGERMLDHFRRVTNVYREHPGLAELIITTPELAWSEQATEIAEEALSLLFEVGLSAAEAQRAAFALSAQIIGEAQLQGVFPSWTPGTASTPIDTERFPSLARTIAENQFHLADWPAGIDMFVAGLERLQHTRIAATK